METNAKTPSLLRDFCEDRQPKILSSQRREYLPKILWPNKKGFKSRNFVLINSPLEQHFGVRRQDSILMYVLVQIALRKQCYGSKKWRWLIQWTIWNLRVPFTLKLISRFRAARREDCNCPEQKHPEFCSKTVSLEEPKSSKSRPILSWKTDR